MKTKKQPQFYYFPLACLIILLILSSFSLQSYAVSDISLQAESVSAHPGEEVNVPIVINTNPGFASLRFAVKYDKANLSLKNITFPKNTGTYSVVPEPYSDNQIINFISPLASFNKTGLFATITFMVNDNATASRMEAITLDFDEDDIFDMNFNPVPLTVSSGSIYVLGESDVNIAKLPSFLVSIEDEAFMNTPFTYVDLPETITTIGSKAFANCNNLKYIYIPENTTRIAADAFLNDSNLVILGKDGSYAQLFANNNGFAFQTR